MSAKDFDKAAKGQALSDIRDLMQDVYALQSHEKRSGDLYQSVLERIVALVPSRPKDARTALYRALNSAEWEQQYNDTITPLAIKAYEEFLAVGQDLEAIRALDHLLAYSRHHYAEEEKVIGAAIESIAVYAGRTTHHNADIYKRAVRKTMDHAAASHRPQLIEQAFCKMWASIGVLRPDMEDTAHSVIYDTYGVAQRHRIFEAFIEGGKDALFTIRQKNPEFAHSTLISHALASAGHHMRTGRMKLDF